MSEPATALKSYYAILKVIPRDVASLAGWIDEVSFWLARIENEEDFRKWTLVLAYRLAEKGDQPFEWYLNRLQDQVVRAMGFEGLAALEGLPDE